MRLFKPKTRGKPTKRFYIDFRVNGVRHTLKAFASKKLSLAYMQNIESILNLRRAGRVPGPDLMNWIDDLPDDIRKKLVTWGVVEQGKQEKPLNNHVQDFKDNLIAKGRTDSHAQQLYNRVNRIFELAGCGIYSDIQASRVESVLADLRDGIHPVSKRTYNFYLKAVKQFCRWMVRDGRADVNPLIHLEPLRVGQTDVIRRRAMLISEVAQLLASVSDSKPRFGMNGHQRAMLYRLALETGLRASELKALKKRDFDLKKGTVSLAGEYTKNRHECTLPLRAETVPLLRDYLKNKHPAAAVFPDMPKIYNISKILRADLLSAGIDPVDNGSGKLDFHALRHTFGTLLAASGVHPKTAMSLMRHSDINLTMNLYSHSLADLEKTAIEGLPNFDGVPGVSDKADRV